VIVTSGFISLGATLAGLSVQQSDEQREFAARVEAHFELNQIPIFNWRRLSIFRRSTPAARGSISGQR